MEERITYFVDVLLPLSLPALYTYRVPFEKNNEIAIGKRVVVQFGKKKIYSAIIKKIHNKAPEHHTVKYIIDVIDDFPIINGLQLKFWEWMADYYMATEGEIMAAALPSAMKLASETKIILNPEFDGNSDNLNDREFLIFEALQKAEVLTISEVSAIVDLKQVINLLKNLFEKGVILEDEEMRQKFTPKKEVYIQLNPEYFQEDAMNLLMNELEKRAPKQLNLLLNFLKLYDYFSDKYKDVSKKTLMHDSSVSASAFNALVEKNVLILHDRIVSRLDFSESVLSPDSIQLSEIQKIAFDSVKHNFRTTKINLLHGVTGSGKTEIYIRLIDEVLKMGKQVLYLLPEIALTSQVINRLRKYFGDKVGVYHSKYSQNERVEIWNKMLSESLTYQIIVGARSAVFLPFANLGLVIVDEEHDTSYKQYDPAPRYHGRDSAIYLSMIHNANCLLGSATPSIETYFKAKSGKYGLTELKERFGDMKMPEIEIVNTLLANKNKTMKSHFSSHLLDEISVKIKQKQQVILFRNRRGFSLRLVCDACQWTPECKNCDVTLTFHKQIQKLKCHYCGYSTGLPEQCPSCGSKKLRLSGFGTEKIENELPIFFPEAHVSRMDLDTTRGKTSYHQIINDFEEGRVDIMVGTQMVSKGLDFENVGLVGVLNADSLINFPDFRSAEKAFQMLTQVSGRAGRKLNRGKVIIQTDQPENAVIQDVIKNDFDSLYERIIKDRQTFHYPPFYRLIRISIKHKVSQELNEAAQIFADLLRKKLGDRVIGPEYPLVGRIKNFFIKDVIIKFEAEASRKFVKDYIRFCISEMDKEQRFRNVLFNIDVDPY